MPNCSSVVCSYNTLGRDLTDIRQRLTGQTTALARLREETNRVEESVRTGDFPAAERPTIERMLKDRQSDLLRTQRDDQAMRAFRIGSDEPEPLAAAIQEALRRSARDL